MEDDNERSAYLASLRGLSTPGSTEVRRPDGPHTPLADKRRSPRFKCEGRAELIEDGCDVRTWASFSDVSLNGCYVEATATFPVGKVLRMKLMVNGFRVETKGVVRVTYPHLGMGIAFSEMSEDNTQQLRAMLRSISRSTIIMGVEASGLVAVNPSGNGIADVADANAAVQALIRFFGTHGTLSREDFTRILHESQPARAAGHASGK
jgi:hypothetical protein